MRQYRSFPKAVCAILACVALAVTGCAEKAEPISVNAVILNTGALELNVGDSYQLVAVITPSNAANQKMVWTTSNASIVSVDMGMITALKQGTATIKVITDDGNKTDSCEVKVNPAGEGDDGSDDDGNGENDGDGENEDDGNGGSEGSDDEGGDTGNEDNEDNGGGDDNEGEGSDGEEGGDDDEDVIGNLAEFVELSSNGTANSYIVSEAGSYKFLPTKGNSASPVGAITSVEVLWESFGTVEVPSPGALIEKVAYEDGIIAFITPERYMEGNASIAARDEQGNILWSWHIWMTDRPKEHVYSNNAGILMDRNLGALSAAAYDPLSIGLLYQWGRKDPFLSLADFGEEDSPGVCVASTMDWPEYVMSDAETGTIEYSISNPATFIVFDPDSRIYDSERGCWTENYDWLYQDYLDVTRWESDKTIYDPCPPGWRVPDPIWETAGIPVNAFGDFSAYVTADYSGFIVGRDYCSHKAWYPASGMRGYWETYDDEYKYMLVAGFGIYWSTSDEGILYCDGYADAGSWDGRYDGHSVRCQKE